MAGAVITLKVPYTEWGKVKEAEFKIGFVSNWVTRELKELTEDAFKVRNEAQALASGEKQFKDANNELFQKAENLLDRKYELVKELLESNGYEFDLKFWDRKTDPEAVNTFLFTAVHKDLQGSKKKA